jgi:hypothetical protein
MPQLKQQLLEDLRFVCVASVDSLLSGIAANRNAVLDPHREAASRFLPPDSGGRGVGQRDVETTMLGG